MTIPAIHHAACGECWHGYFGEHADWCSQSAAVTCPTCGNIYYTDRGAARCTWDHSHINATSQKEAA